MYQSIILEKLIENGEWFWRKSYKKFTTEAIDRKRDKYWSGKFGSGELLNKIKKFKYKRICLFKM